MSANLNGDVRRGIWVTDSYGKVGLEVVEEEVESASNKSYQCIILIANQWWISHSANGSTNRSIIYDDANDSPNYSTTLSSVYESLIITGNDSSKKKKLIGVTVFTEPLPTAGQVVLKYRKDEETSFTTIFTHTTANSLSHSAINIESNGDELPEFYEIQLQILSTGGVEITGIRFRYEIIDSDIY